MTFSIRDALDDDFRLLVAEIADTEQVPWHVAMQRARELHSEVSALDPDAPIPYRPRRDWRFIAWCMLLLLLVSVSVNLALVWALVTAI